MRACESEQLDGARLEAEELWGEQRGQGGARASLHGGQEEGEKRCSHTQHLRGPCTVLTGQTHTVPRLVMMGVKGRRLWRTKLSGHPQQPTGMSGFTRYSVEPQSAGGCFLDAVVRR